MQSDFSPAICHTCGTAVMLDDKGNVKDYNVPEYHRIIWLGSCILFLIFCIAIIIEATVTHHTNEKLAALGIVLLTGVICYFFLPIRMGLSVEYGRTWVALTMAILSGGMMVLHLSDLINY